MQSHTFLEKNLPEGQASCEQGGIAVTETDVAIENEIIFRSQR